MKPLKDTYTHKGIFEELAHDMVQVYTPLDEKVFYRALVKGLNALELKARIERAADVCYEFLPQSYSQALKVLYRFVEGKPNRLIYLFLPTFVSKYGQAHYDLSLKALSDFTQYSSSEEGVRVYLEKDLKKTLNIMLQWTRSKNTHIRRLASEGCRPYLPWAKKVLALVEQPKLMWPILERLKKDPEKYVQKSVANHINDISKDHGDWVVQQVSKWDLSHDATKWIVKHGLRTLIKQGHHGAMSLFGSGKKPKVKISGTKWNRRVRRNQKCSFHFEMNSTSREKQSLIVDYKIYFQKKKGMMNPKVFKLRECELKPRQKLVLGMYYTFKDMTTRKHYPGEHAWELLINGESCGKFPFQLV